MSVSFEKNKDQILSAWNEVLNDKTPTNWALFSYEKQSNEICLVEKGDGGLEELAEEFNTAKIMYGLARVTDPNTSLPKFVFINWQGEGAPLTRKGVCSNHISDVSKFFKGANIHINARTEEDVEPDFILEKVSKASSSKFNFSERSEVVENVAPVGSVYKRTRPNAEINPSEREKFWIKQAEEEARRVENEKKKAEEDQKKLEQERKQREIQEAQKREEKLREKYRTIDKQREAVKNAENTAKIKEREQRTVWMPHHRSNTEFPSTFGNLHKVKQQLQEITKEKEEVSQRGDNLKKERKNEAEALISTRTINARAIFEQNTSAGQMSALKGKSQVPLNHQELTSPAKEMVAPTSNQPAYAEVTKTVINFASPAIADDLPLHESILKDIPEERTYEDPEEEDRYLREKLASSPLLLATGSGEGLKARALYDYQAADETEISFDPDDIITQIDQIDEGWWQGMAPDGSFGLFPANYVELIN